jgi:hypothetical protein
VLDPQHENTRTVDVTARTPEESAAAVLREIELIVEARGK